MARHGVIVKRLQAIENFGSMDVLCTDKTGTVTVGIVRLDRALDASGVPSDAVFRDAWLNAHLQTGLTNPLDESIVASTPPNVEHVEKIDEIPYDFVRKRLSVAVRDGIRRVLITKGALKNVLEVCTHVREDNQDVVLDAERRARIETLYTGWSGEGFRVLGVGTKPLDERDVWARHDEHGLTFSGFLLFFDPPKPGVEQVLGDLKALGIALKIVTGDNALVARHVAETVGMDSSRVLTGEAMSRMNDEALWHAAERTSIFAQVDPNQKERIILALKKTGHIVGYLGDGINDAPALHAADVSISVDKAADVAKDAADFVLLEQNLDVLRRGILEGRITFANTLKYVMTTTIANLGNMLSMAVASVFLPFLPLLATQILLNNFLSDFPAMTIAGDSVDPEQLARPRRWDMRFIRNFMIVFGLVSSAFDLLTFWLLLAVFRMGETGFRSGWFVESLLTEIFVALVIRTRMPFYRSRPGTALLFSSLGVAVITVLIPWLPFARPLGFTPLPLSLMAALLGITAAYVVAVEATKRLFFRRIQSRSPA